MPKIFENLFLFVSMLGLALTAQAKEPTLQKADSLFTAQRFSEAGTLYSKAFSEQKTTSKANLLKLAFIEEGRDNDVLAIFYLHQFYLLQPEKQVKIKIEELAGKNKYQGYSIDEADYGYFLYRTYGPLLDKILLSLAIVLFLFLIYRKLKGTSLGYTPVFTLIFLLVSGYFFNFSLPYKRAIVQGEKTFIMSGPSSGSSLLGTLEKGHRVEWIGENDVWYEIKWNEKKGWVKKSGLLFFL